ncbi:uncharacterized protein LOC126318053 [Schistocerca gregaria]|uniref:uncharacterized protein LOC126318053 n=1 Tax=Schistocerca gregaria TaxID=7010 RepID=UPI00211DBAF5|nr:uncharacterized protein LOC126318053 [Schistocerca gregaria]
MIENMVVQKFKNFGNDFRYFQSSTSTTMTVLHNTFYISAFTIVQGGGYQYIVWGTMASSLPGCIQGCRQTGLTFIMGRQELHQTSSTDKYCRKCHRCCRRGHGVIKCYSLLY